MPRYFAAVVAITCWMGVSIQFAASYANIGDVTGTLWVILRFFTIITNLLVAIAMTLVAVGRPLGPVVLGGLTMALALVGIVFAVLLEGLKPLGGAAAVADFLNHKASPVLMTLWWLFFAPRARLAWSAPLIWAAYPIAYFAYALARGQADGKYPYPFIDVAKLGWSQTLLNAGGIALAFLIVGTLVVAFERWRHGGKLKRR
ncbi:Pr6Pr family membrane protein [Sphingomonas piscis]|uniref:Pr6Pr family membrane protein n=1 Tax=Sphingomonas piscis TaxID=2714943 RepID=UPI0019D1E016|nr:Pr6Pr family membrane protein [Sphingomonas piscis]